MAQAFLPVWSMYVNMRRWLMNVALDGLGEAVGELLVSGLMLGILLLLSLPIYFVMKKFKLGPKRWHRNQTFKEDLRETLTNARFESRRTVENGEANGPGHNRSDLVHVRFSLTAVQTLRRWAQSPWPASH